MARLDLGWNRDDIDFDKSGRLVFKNPALAEEIRKALVKSGNTLELYMEPSTTQDTATQDTTTQCTDPKPDGEDEAGIKVPPPPPVNMCGCRATIPDPRKPGELEVQPRLGPTPR